MKRTLKKGLKIFLWVILGLVIIACVLFIIGRPKKNIIWGLTFSTLHAEELGFNPEQLFQNIITDFHPKKVRLPVYWSELEPVAGQYDFSMFDKLLKIADDNNVHVLVVVGKKQPRWPECHQPDWVNSLDAIAQETAQLTMIEKAVTHFKSHPSVESWQVENEPYFQYGPACPATTSTFLKKEISLVKKLDTRPIVTTDSGEKGFWVTAASSGADTLGATMYREAYYEKRKTYVTYLFPWWTYNVKAGQVKLFTGAQRVIGVELQTEPWLTIADPAYTPVDQQLEHMNPEIFKRNIAYAKKVGFAENYLWGVEWWYWMKDKQDHPEMWQVAKDFFK